MFQKKMRRLILSKPPHLVPLRVSTSAPAETRTRNLLIRSQALCPLSYGGEQAYYTANHIWKGKKNLSESSTQVFFMFIQPDFTGSFAGRRRRHYSLSHRYLRIHRIGKKLIYQPCRRRTIALIRGTIHRRSGIW